MSPWSNLVHALHAAKTGDLSEHFSRKEFRCACGCGAEAVSPRLIDLLESARRLYGHPITILSGVRCLTHNRAVGGVPNSAHIHGLAADIACPSSGSRYVLLMTLLTVGATRIGLGDNFLHVDIDETLPQDVVWIYSTAKGQW